MTILARRQAPTTINPLQPVHITDGIDIQTTSVQECIPRTEIQNGDDDYSFERQRALTKMTPDGLKPLSPEEVELEKQTTKNLLKKFASGILKADSNALSFPIIYSEPRSYLERFADIFSFLVEKYIDKAMDPRNDNDRKLAFIATGIMAGFHIDIGPKKVFNPILGETYYGIYENGTQIFAEQSSHHPPLSDIELIGPDNKWRCYAHMDFDIDSGLNNVDLKQNGIFHLEIKDGNTYEWKYPNVQIAGFVKGDRIVKVKGNLEVIDVTNNIICSVEISPRKDKKKGIDQTLASGIYGGTKANEKSVKDFRHKINGNYVDQIYIDGEVLWDIQRDIVKRPVPAVPDDMILPSDVRFRLDRNLLIQGKTNEADKAKTTLEEFQRREENLRDSISIVSEIKNNLSGKFKLGKRK